MIDLTFFNVFFITVKVVDILYPKADYKDILIILPSQGRLSCKQYRFFIPDNKFETFTGLVTIRVVSIFYPSITSTAEKIDEII